MEQTDYRKMTDEELLKAYQEKKGNVSHYNNYQNVLKVLL